MKHERILAMLHHSVPIKIRKDFLALNLQHFDLFLNLALEQVVDPSDCTESRNPIAPRASLFCYGQLLVPDQTTNLGREWFIEVAIRIVFESTLR